MSHAETVAELERRLAHAEAEVVRLSVEVHQLRELGESITKYLPNTARARAFLAAVRGQPAPEATP